MWGMTKEVLRAKLTAVIGLVHTLTGFQALLPKSDVVIPSNGNPFFQLFFKFRQSGSKIVRLIAKERLSGPTSPIINVELEFEGSGRALHFFSTLIWGVSRIFAPNCSLLIYGAIYSTGF